MLHEFWKPPKSETVAQPREDREALPGLSLRVIESAGFLAMVTAILYFMGYSYYRGFFERLALPPPYPELSTTDYFLQGFSGLTGLIVAALVSIPYLATVPTTVPRALWVNSAFIFVPLILAQNARSSGFLEQWLALILATVAIGAIIASLVRRSIMKLLTWRWGLAGAIAYGFAMFSFLSLYFRLEGTADATRFIEGRLEPSSAIVLQTSDAQSAVDEKRLLVALMRSGGFYLVEQESPAPEYPVVYFVPESEVRTAKMQGAGAPVPTPMP